MHGPDDVAALAKLPQGRLGLGRDGPSPGLDLGGQPHALQLARPLDQQRPVLPQAVEHVPVRTQVGELVAALLLGDQHTVQPGEAVGIDLPLQAARHLQLGLPAQLPGNDLACPLPDAMGDVVAGDVEGLAVVGDAPDDDVGVGMAGVVMIDRDPVELGAEVGFHLLHQIAGGGARIGQLDAVLGRHDEAELVAVLAAPFDEGAAILHIALGRIDLALLAVLRHAVAFEIAQVRVHRLGADELPAPSGSALRVELHDAGLDRDPPRPRADPAVPAPGAPILQRQRRRRAPAPRIEPAASLPGPDQPGGIAAGPPDGLMDLAQEAGRTAAHRRPARRPSGRSHPDHGPCRDGGGSRRHRVP